MAKYRGMENEIEFGDYFKFDNYIVITYIMVSTVNSLKIRTPEKICCNLSKIRTRWLYHRIMCPKGTDRIANSVDPDQTAPRGAVISGCSSRNSLIWVYIVCPDLSVKKLRIITVNAPKILHNFLSFYLST